MKKYISIILILLMMFVGCVSVMAFPDGFITNSAEGPLTLDSTTNLSVVVSNRANDAYEFPFFRYKNTTIGGKTKYVLCISGSSYQDPADGINYEKANWDESKAKAVAYIIDTVIGNNNVNYTNYYYAQILVEDYLDKYDPSGKNFETYIIKENNGSTMKIANSGLTYNQILNGALYAATTTYKTTLNVDNNTLQFTKGNDGYWYANVKITSNTDISFESISNDEFNYELVSKKDNNYNYKFKIADSKIGLGSTQSFEITIKNSSMFYKIASRYIPLDHPSEGEYQDVTLAYVENKEVQGQTLKITGSVSKPKASIKVAKINKNGDLIKDAELVFQTEADYEAKKETKKITTKESYITINDLVAGKYYLSEKTAPSGYDKSSKVMEIVISNDGTIKVDGVTSNGTIRYSNELTKTNISKKDVTGKNELPGATLTVLDKDKKSMSCTIIKDGKEEKLDKCTWVSGTKSVQIVGLAAGKYYLKETIAPDRYVLNEEMVSFEVKADGTTTNVVMTNKLNKVVISKLNAFTKKELPGATLEIQNEDGEIVKYCSDKEKNNECKWVSTEEPYEIEGLPNGTYYLVETIAPKGFILNKEKVKFVVDGKTAVSYVEMTNELEVEVPDTLSSNSVLLTVISMFNIALGIGIINYVKKNRFE